MNWPMKFFGNKMTLTELFLHMMILCNRKNNYCCVMVIPISMATIPILSGKMTVSHVHSIYHMILCTKMIG